jgi:hypothetical protein
MSAISPEENPNIQTSEIDLDFNFEEKNNSKNLNKMKKNFEKIKFLKELSFDFLHINCGLIYDRTTRTPIPVPYTLLPSPLPAPVADLMWNSNQFVMELYAKVASNHDFLLHIFENFDQNDEFLNMLKKTLKMNYQRNDNPLCLVGRNDYMVHEEDVSNVITSSSSGSISTLNLVSSKNENNDEKNAELSPPTTPLYNPQSLIINKIKYTPQQVEFNTISCGLLSLSQKTQNLHQYLLKNPHLAIDPVDNSDKMRKFGHFFPHRGSNGTADTLSMGISYLEKVLMGNGDEKSDEKNIKNKKVNIFEHLQYFERPAVLFVVQDIEFNVPDQKLIEMSLFQHQIPVIRLTFSQISEQISFIDPVSFEKFDPNDESNTSLGTDFTPPHHRKARGKIALWKGKIPIGVVYYRAGYGPGDFFMSADSGQESDEQNDGNDEQNAEKTSKSIKKSQTIQIYQSLEASLSVKCPNIGLFLSGMKKVQQLLTKRDVLSHFLGQDSAKVDMISGLFAEMYSLQEVNADIGEVGVGNDHNNSKNLASNSIHTNDSVINIKTINGIKNAINHPNDWTLKPMREGGGNNLYGDDVKQNLLQRTVGKYILMKKIKTNPNYSHFLLSHNNNEKKNKIQKDLHFVRNDDNSIWFDENNNVYNEDCEYSKTISEYGIGAGLFGTVNYPNNVENNYVQHNYSQISTNSTINIQHNETYGVLVRVKRFQSNEGGLAIGKAFLGSLIKMPVETINE